MLYELGCQVDILMYYFPFASFLTNLQFSSFRISLFYLQNAFHSCDHLNGVEKSAVDIFISNDSVALNTGVTLRLSGISTFEESIPQA